MAPRLDAVARAVEILGDVHRAAPVIHITGTNGKTSTACMIEALLLGHDLRVGRFTSPHSKALPSVSAFNGAPVPDATFVRIWEEIAPLPADRGRRDDSPRRARPHLLRVHYRACLRDFRG